ncbi:MAG: hypothetical protein ACTSRO_09395 [Candidatus Heimdallarchaeaceae archaeon]
MKKKRPKKENQDLKKEDIQDIDYSYITKEEMIEGFKPSNHIQKGVVLCPYCSSTNLPEDEFCFNCGKRIWKEEKDKML